MLNKTTIEKYIKWVDGEFTSLKDFKFSESKSIIPNEMLDNDIKNSSLRVSLSAFRKEIHNKIEGIINNSGDNDLITNVNEFRGKLYHHVEELISKRLSEI